MIIGQATRVPEAVRTLHDFIVGALNLQSFGVSPEAIDALVDEIWNAPANAYLQKVPRDHRGGSKNGDLEVAPDEWVYLPFAPPAGYEVRRFDLTERASSEDDVCQKIRAQYDEAGMDFPGGHLTPADLENVLFNSALRGGLETTEVYFYVVPSLMIVTDVAPVTGDTPGAPTVSSAQATPDWILPLWHWIDRLHAKSQEHAAVLQDLFDLCSEGKLMAMALTTVDKFLTVLERECKTPKPTSILDRIGQAFDPASNLFDIADFHAKLKALRDAAQKGYVEDCAFPLIGQFRSVCDELKALEADLGFGEVYLKFDKVRSRYPVTEHALQSVLAFYALCRGHSPDGEDFVAKIDKAVHGSPESTPCLLEIASILKGLADDVVSPAAAMVGNAPGPLTMLVAFGKLHLLWQLRTPATAVVSVEQYVVWAAKLANVPADQVAQEVARAGPGRNARLFVARIQATELAASQMQASARWLKTVSFLDAIVLVSTACSTVGDIKQKGWLNLDVATDLAGTATSGVALVAAVLQLRVAAKQAVFMALKNDGQIEAAKLVEAAAGKLGGMASICGRMVGLLGIVSGALQVWQGIRDKDSADRWAEIGGGTGTILVSMQPFLDVFFARVGPQIGARVIVILTEVVAEETAAAIGGSLVVAMAGAAATLAGIGVLVVLVALIYKNRQAISAFLAEEATPGPAKACRAYLKAVESSRAYAVGPADVRSALAQATSALDHAMFINYVPPDKVKAELRAAGMSDEDLRILGTIAPFSPDVTMRAQMAM